MPLKYRTRRVSKNKRKTVKRGGDDSVPATATPSTILPSWLNWSSLTSGLSSSKQPAAEPGDTAATGNTAAPVEQPAGGNKRSKKYKSRKSRKSKK